MRAAHHEGGLMPTVITLRNGTILFPVYLTRPGRSYDRLADNVVALPVKNRPSVPVLPDAQAGGVNK